MLVFEKGKTEVPREKFSQLFTYYDDIKMSYIFQRVFTTVILFKH